MIRKTFTFMLAVLLAAACGKSLEHSVSELYRSVPSRSVMVARFSDCRQGLSLLLDSTAVLRSLDYGKLAGNDAILSFDYNSGLVPMLCIRTGRAAADTSKAAAALIEDAAGKGVRTCYVGNFLNEHSILLLSSSQAVLDEAKSHIDRGASIMDAPAFSDAVMLDDGSDAAIILRNESARRWLPKSLPEGLPSSRKLAPFISNLAEWSVLNFEDFTWEDVSARFYDGDSYNCFSKVMESVPSGKSALAGHLPDSTDFAFDLLLASGKGFLDSYKSYLDANATLSKYKSNLAGLKSGKGKNPESWFGELDPREIALVRWEGHEVLLLRPASKRDDSTLETNPYPGYLPALLGEAFRIADDSAMAYSRPWMVYGSEPDVKAWVDAARESSFWEEDNYSFYVYSRGLSILGNNKKLVLNAY